MVLMVLKNKDNVAKSIKDKTKKNEQPKLFV